MHACMLGRMAAQLRRRLDGTSSLPEESLIKVIDESGESIGKLSVDAARRTAEHVADATRSRWPNCAVLMAECPVVPATREGSSKAGGTPDIVIVKD